jgi:hypothetical protein
MFNKHIRTRAFLDRVSITLPIPEEHWLTTTDAIFEMSNADSRIEPRRGGNESRSFQLYNFAWIVRPSASQSHGIYVQALPRVNNIAYMRMEWNPATLGQEAFHFARDLFRRYIPEFDRATTSLAVTRVDIAVDITGLRVTDVYAYTSSARSIQLDFFDGPNDELSGYYIGRKKSPRQFVVYDKNLEEFGGNTRILRYPSGTQVKRILRPRTRIELRVHNVGSLGAIRYGRNQFAGYFLADASKVDIHRDSILPSGFCANCGLCGAQRALSRYTPRTRASLRHNLAQHCNFPWYSPDAFWQEGIAQLHDVLGR